MPVDRSTLDRAPAKPRVKLGPPLPPPRRVIPPFTRPGGPDLPRPPEYTYRTTGPGLVTVHGRVGGPHEAMASPQLRPPLTYADLANQDRVDAALADAEIARRQAQAAANVSRWARGHRTPAQRAKAQRLADILSLGAGPLDPSIVPPLRRPSNLFQTLGLNEGADLRDAASRPPLYESILAPGKTTRITPQMQALGEQAAYHGAPPARDVKAAQSYIAAGHNPEDITIRGARVQQAGIPLGAAGKWVIDAARTLDPGARTNILAGFPRLDQPTNPDVTAELRDAARARGVTPPVNPTLSDLYAAKYGPKPGSYWNVLENLPRDFALTPVYAAEGGYAIGAAAKRAFLLGDYSGLREVAAQQVDAIRRPGAFLQQHPFQAGLALIGAAKAGGRAAAVGRDLEVTPRTIPLLDPATGEALPPVGGEVPALNRGVLSTRNLTVRGAQKLSDALYSRGPLATRLQGGAVARVLRDARAEARATVEHEAGQALKPFMEARGKVSRKATARVLENEARGITPAQHAAFRGQEPPNLPPLTPAQEALHASLVGLDRAQIERAGQMGLLGETAAQRRAYLPAIHVAAQAGNDAAQHFLELDKEVDQLHSQLRSVDDERARKLERQLTQLRQQRDAAFEQQVSDLDARIAKLREISGTRQMPGQKPRRRGTPGEIKALEQRRTNLLRQQTPFADITSAPIRKLEQRLAATPTKGQVSGALDAAIAEHRAALERFTQQHLASGAPAAAYVPEREMKRVQSPFARPGGGAGLAAAKRRYTQTGGPYRAHLFREGTYEPITERMVIQHYGVPGRVEAAYRFAQEVSNPARGIVKRVSVGADEPRLEIPPGYVAQLERPHTSALADELHGTTGSLAPTDPLHSLTSTFDLRKTHVEPGETVRLWPTSVYERLAGMHSLNPPTGKGAIAATAAGRYLRNALLYSRPAYPLTNMVGNMAQSALVAGNIPFGPSYQDALKRSGLAVPPRIEGTGTAAVNFDALGSGSFRNAWEDRGSPAGGVARVALHPIARYTQELYRSSVAIEDWTRRATYLSKAVPEARRIAHPEAGRIQRFAMSFRRADDAVKEVLQQMADGATPETRAAAERAIKVVHQALGDYASMHSNRALDVVVPFHRWTRFVSRLMLDTLPLHYPGRALLLYRLGALGQAGQHQMGNLTPSLQGIIPSGTLGAWTTQAVNPFATIGQNLLPLQGSTSINTSGAIRNVSPFIQIPYELASGRDPTTGMLLRNEKGQAIGGFDTGGGIGESQDPLDRLRLLASQGVGLIPLSRGLAPLFGGGQPNAPATSIDLPWLVQHGPHRSTPQQPAQGALASIMNQISPVKYRSVDLALAAKQGSRKYHQNLQATAKANRKAEIDAIAARIAARRGVDMSNRNTAAAQHVLQDAFDEYARRHP